MKEITVTVAGEWFLSMKILWDFPSTTSIRKQFCLKKKKFVIFHPFLTNKLNKHLSFFNPSFHKSNLWAEPFCLTPEHINWKIQDLRWRLAQGVAKNMNYLFSSPEQDLQSSDTEHASRIIPGFPHSNPSALPGFVDIWIYRESDFEFRFLPRWFFPCWHLQEEMWLSLQEYFFQHHLWCVQYCPVYLSQGKRADTIMKVLWHSQY